MPRFVDSSVGGRTLTIPDAADRFTSPGNMADGTSRLGVGMNTALSPTYGHCYDRAAGAADYVLAAGQPKTIVIWLNWWEVGSFAKMGVCEANTPTTGDNWAISRNSGSGRRQFFVYNGSGGASQPNVGASGTGTSGVPEMIALTWTGVEGAADNLRGFGEGAFVQAATLTTIKAPPTTPQLWFGRKANIALGSFSPTTNAASPNSGVCEMAKLSVFDYVLSDGDIADLYVAMTS
jgi:hypothetical protein